MPWKVEKSSECPASKPWACVRESDGYVEGCHETEDAAKKQQAALYASERTEKASEPRHKLCPLIDTKALDDGEVTAMFSVFGNVDLVGDRILPGAFTKTLERWQTKGDLLPIVVSHQWDDVWAHIGYAEPDQVKQMPRGVVVRAQIDVDDNPLAKQAHKLMKRGTLKAWSFGYTVPEGGEKLVEEEPGMVNEISELDLIEAGPTLKGANPEAQLQAAKGFLDVEEERGELGKGAFSVHFARSLKTFTPESADGDVPAEEPSKAKAHTPDPLRQRSRTTVLLETVGDLRPKKPEQKRTPTVPEPELRRQSRALMLDVLIGEDQ